MTEGWIKTHRSLMDWEWYQDSNMVHLFLHMIMKANHEEKKWRGVTVKRGQFISSRDKLSCETGISAQTIRTCIERLKATKELTSVSTSQYTIYTIVNYNDYQEDDRPNNQQPTSETTSNQPAANQQSTTNNNEKNIITSYAREEIFLYASLKIQKIIKAPLPVNTQRLHAWLDAGWDVELDIIPVIENLVKARNQENRPPPTSLKYFEAAIADSFATRTAPVKLGIIKETPKNNEVNTEWKQKYTTPTSNSSSHIS